MFQRFTCITLVRDRLVALRLLRAPVAGANRDLIEAGGADLLFDRSLRARAYRHHRQHRRHADGDAEHRQAGLQAVAAERLDRDIDDGMAEKRRHAKAAEGTEALELRSSETITPSLKSTVRVPYAAISRS